MGEGKAEYLPIIADKLQEGLPQHDCARLDVYRALFPSLEVLSAYSQNATVSQRFKGDIGYCINLVGSSICRMCKVSKKDWEGERGGGGLKGIIKACFRSKNKNIGTEQYKGWQFDKEAFDELLNKQELQNCWSKLRHWQPLLLFIAWCSRNKKGNEESIEDSLHSLALSFDANQDVVREQLEGLSRGEHAAGPRFFEDRVPRYLIPDVRTACENIRALSKRNESDDTIKAAINEAMSIIFLDKERELLVEYVSKCVQSKTIKASIKGLVREDVQEVINGLEPHVFIGDSHILSAGFAEKYSEELKKVFKEGSDLGPRFPDGIGTLRIEYEKACRAIPKSDDNDLGKMLLEHPALEELMERAVKAYILGAIVGPAPFYGVLETEEAEARVIETSPLAEVQSVGLTDIGVRLQPVVLSYIDETYYAGYSLLKLNKLYSAEMGFDDIENGKKIAIGRAREFCNPADGTVADFIQFTDKDTKISNMHAWLYKDKESNNWCLQDCGSKNGTLVIRCRAATVMDLFKPLHSERCLPEEGKKVTIKPGDFLVFGEGRVQPDEAASRLEGKTLFDVVPVYAYRFEVLRASKKTIEGLTTL